MDWIQWVDPDEAELRSGDRLDCAGDGDYKIEFIQRRLQSMGNRSVRLGSVNGGIYLSQDHIFGHENYDITTSRLLFGESWNDTGYNGGS